MDSVKKFINDNQFQLGYIMDEASRKWIENDPVGALTVGDCNFVVQKYGEYHEILEKMQNYEKALRDITTLSYSRYNDSFIKARKIADTVLGE